jgi:predicted kinase
MPKLYVLVGVPASGKSTWVSKQDWDLSKVAYISTDVYVEDHAKKIGKTYSEVFKDFMPDAIAMMMEDVRAAKREGKDIIWDQTSTTIASRTRKFNMLPGYEHIAVVFRTPARDELDVRLSGRPGKHIPKNVVDSMIAGWDEPELDEGFKEIWYAS